MDYTTLDFFGYNEDQKKVLALLKESRFGGEKIALMTAPSFVVDFDPESFVPLMRGLGFDKITELTFGAKIVNQHYHKFIHDHYSSYVSNGKKKDENFQKVFIASVCPASVSLIQTQHPELTKYLLPFVSPMGAMAKIIKKNFPKYKIVFLSPCGAKKVEATKILQRNKKPLIDACVTFLEMKQIIAKEKPQKMGSKKFDSFYNDYTKIYPLSGGLSSTLHYKGILKKEEIVFEDGCADLQRLFSNHPDKVFYDILFCDSGCIGGPGVASRKPIFWRKNRVINYRNKSRRNKAGKRIGLEKYTKGLDFSMDYSKKDF